MFTFSVDLSNECSYTVHTKSGRQDRKISFDTQSFYHRNGGHAMHDQDLIQPIEAREHEIIAVDFDGTLCIDAYPSIGTPNLPLICYLKQMQSHNARLILWTCRSGEPLKEAVNWCVRQGLIFDAVNENLPETISKYGSDSRKITADIYIDDRARLPWDDPVSLAM